MKKKEIIIVITSLSVIGLSIYFMLQLLFPANQQESDIIRESETIPTIKTEIDEDAYQAIEELSDYGLPDLDGIGTNDIFRYR